MNYKKLFLLFALAFSKARGFAMPLRRFRWSRRTACKIAGFSQKANLLPSGLGFQSCQQRLPIKFCFGYKRNSATFAVQFSLMYKLIIRRMLFWFDPEEVHHFTFSLIRFICAIPGFSGIFRLIYEVEDKRLEREVFGLQFKNPVGLAAGFDKDAKLYNELSNFGFGFIEIGTLTPKPQEGNPKKRLFRLKEDAAIINRMGFNNGGVKRAAERLKKNKGVLIGGNIGKNKDTPNENAASDYEICFDALYDVVDYFVVNVSSPNTPNLRALQEKAPLTKLLQTLQQRKTGQTESQTDTAQNCTRPNR